MDDDILLGIWNRVEEIHDYITLMEQSGYEIDNCDDYYSIKERLNEIKDRLSNL